MFYTGQCLRNRGGKGSSRHMWFYLIFPKRGTNKAIFTKFSVLCPTWVWDLTQALHDCAKIEDFSFLAFTCFVYFNLILHLHILSRDMFFHRHFQLMKNSVMGNDLISYIPWLLESGSCFCWSLSLSKLKSIVTPIWESGSSTLFARFIRLKIDKKKLHLLSKYRITIFM